MVGIGDGFASDSERTESLVFQSLLEVTILERLVACAYLDVA